MSAPTMMMILRGGATAFLVPLGILLAGCGPGADDAAGDPGDPSSEQEVVGATTSPSKPADWTGLYVNETGSGGVWAIRIASRSPFTFRLFAANLADPENVDADRLVAKPQGRDSYFYENGPDCAITFKRSANDGINVTQMGRCVAIGFPPNDGLSISDESGADFSKIDETKECFDKKARTVRVGSCAARF